MQLGPWDWLDELPHLTTYFLAGSAVYANRRRLPRPRVLAGVSLVGLAASMRTPWLEWTMPLAWSYLLLYIAFIPARPGRWSGLGNLSFGMYLYAFAIQQLLIAAWHPTLGPERLFLVSFGLSLLAGWFSWNLVEKPCLKFKIHSRAEVATLCTQFRRVESSPFTTVSATLPCADVASDSNFEN